jgi:hypothetical protein
MDKLKPTSLAANDGALDNELDLDKETCRSPPKPSNSTKQEHNVEGPSLGV